MVIKRKNLKERLKKFDSDFSESLEKGLRRKDSYIEYTD